MEAVDAVGRLKNKMASVQCQSYSSTTKSCEDHPKRCGGKVWFNWDIWFFLKPCAWSLASPPSSKRELSITPDRNELSSQYLLAFTPTTSPAHTKVSHYQNQINGRKASECPTTELTINNENQLLLLNSFSSHYGLVVLWDDVEMFLIITALLPTSVHLFQNSYWKWPDISISQCGLEFSYCIWCIKIWMESWYSKIYNCTDFTTSG